MPSPVLLPTTLSIPRWLKRVLLGFGLTFDLHASACLNEYQTLITGKVDMDIGQYCPLFRKDINKEELAAELRFLERLDLTNEQRSDKGALLIYLGRYEEAISLYQDLLDEGWNAYTVHSNLGTAYELIGRNDSALLHIKRALDIDPTSHKGSEWIHVKILEYKIAEATGEKFSSVLGLTFGNHAIPKTPEGIDPELFREQLIHQLEERMTFVHPKDPIVGELLFELGNVQALLNTVECAVDVYGLPRSTASPLRSSICVPLHYRQ